MGRRAPPRRLKLATPRSLAPPPLTPHRSLLSPRVQSAFLVLSMDCHEKPGPNPPQPGQHTLSSTRQLYRAAVCHRLSNPNNILTLTLTPTLTPTPSRSATASRCCMPSPSRTSAARCSCASSPQRPSSTAPTSLTSGPSRRARAAPTPGAEGCSTPSGHRAMRSSSRRTRSPCSVG